ncbi:amidohydrolase [Carnobacterium gallinarum]|uniref:amidohydrolase n=1 Tax=Carnobacterium gallinarum TaxID=2749 RepID=UPI00054DAFB0|nr:amidohydrolase [Carnobacterium gallinarum]
MITLIKNVYILTMNANFSEYPEGYLLIEDELIVAVGELAELTAEIKWDQVVDGKGGILLPGMVNTHTHVGMIPFRSLGDDTPDRLRQLLFPLENSCMTKELAYHSAKYALAEMQLAGITTVVDMYYFEDAILEAADEMDIRGIFGETIIDFPTCDSVKPHGGLSYAKDLIPRWINHKKLTPAIAPHATNTNHPNILIEANQLALKKQVPFTIHVAEMDYEVAFFEKEYDLTPVGFLNKLDCLGEHVIAAHCIHVTEADIQLLKQTGTKVAHCIGANTKSAKGVAPIKAMLDAGISVGLGTDGPSSGNTLDLFTQMKLVANFHKTDLQDRSAFPAKEIVRLATMGGAEVVGLEKEIGSLEVGKKADFMIIETESVNMFPIFDPYAVLVYSANASNVQSVYSDGCLLVDNKQLVNHSLRGLKINLQQEMTAFYQRVAELTE